MPVYLCGCATHQIDWIEFLFSRRTHPCNARNVAGYSILAYGIPRIRYASYTVYPGYVVPGISGIPCIRLPAPGTGSHSRGHATATQHIASLVCILNATYLRRINVLDSTSRSQFLPSCVSHRTVTYLAFTELLNSITSTSRSSTLSFLPSNSF